MNKNIKEIGVEVGLNMEPMLPGGFPNEGLIVTEAFARAVASKCIELLYEKEQSLQETEQDIIDYFGIR